MGKGENAGNQNKFQSHLFCSVTFILLSADALNLDWLKILLFGKELIYVRDAIEKRVLTHYQTTNFRLFQTERVCRPQFEIGRKWQKVIQTGRKRCGKRRNCSLRAISPFPSVFKGLFPRGSKGVFVWEWVNPFPNKPWGFICLQYKFLENTGIKRNCSEQAISLFPTVFSFSSNFKLSSANSSRLEESKICLLRKD